MYYDEVNICGELFYAESPTSGWIRMPNKMLTERLEKTQADLAAANETLDEIQKAVKKYIDGGTS